MTTAIGCGKCTRCNEQMILFANNTIAGWVCRACGKGALGERRPKACRFCSKEATEDRVARLADVCVCPKCHALAMPKAGEFDVPTEEELKRLFS